jgi:hypothetical protein
MSRNSFLGWGSRKTASHRRSPKQERALAERSNGRLVPGSGSGYQKGDIQVKRLLRIEAKTTKADSFRVTRSMVEKITEAGILHDEFPAIVVEFVDEQGRPEHELLVMPGYVLDHLLELARHHDAEKGISDKREDRRGFCTPGKE